MKSLFSSWKNHAGHTWSGERREECLIGFIMTLLIEKLSEHKLPYSAFGKYSDPLTFLPL
jgi:hypothetical protein